MSQTAFQTPVDSTLPKLGNSEAFPPLDQLNPAQNLKQADRYHKRTAEKHRIKNSNIDHDSLLKNLFSKYTTHPESNFSDTIENTQNASERPRTPCNPSFPSASPTSPTPLRSPLEFWMTLAPG